MEHAEQGKFEEQPQDVLNENLFRLLAMFWTELSRDGNMNNNAIVHFTGVLGIYPVKLFFWKAYDYTPFLLALLWVGRLIVLEYALLVTAYTYLSVPWPERRAYADQA